MYLCKMKFFTQRKTKPINYKIHKYKRINNQRYYVVKFKAWLMGWYTIQMKYDSVTDVDLTFDTKDDAKQFIENEISMAYKKLM